MEGDERFYQGWAALLLRVKQVIDRASNQKPHNLNLSNVRQFYDIAPSERMEKWTLSEQQKLGYNSGRKDWKRKFGSYRIVYVKLCCITKIIEIAIS